MKKTDGVGGQIRRPLTEGRSLRVRWLRNREAGVMEYWSIGVLERWATAPPAICTPWRDVGDFVVRHYTTSSIQVTSLIRQSQILAGRVRFAFEREERAHNHQKQNTATSSARSGRQLRSKRKKWG